LITMTTDWRTHPNPTAIKHAGVSEYMEKAAAFKDYRLFADVNRKLLPVDTPEAMVASAAFYYGHCDANPTIEAALVKSAALFKLENSLQGIKELFEAETVKSASAETELIKYAYSKDGVNAYDISGHMEIDASAEGLLKDLHEGRITPAIAREAACAMVKVAANSADVHLPARIRSLGGSESTDWDRVERLVRSRRDAGYTPDDLSFMNSCIKAASAGAVVDSPDRISESELVEFMTSIDAERGVKYASHPTPEEIVYCGAPAEVLKKAAASFHLLGGTPVPAGITASVKPSEWQRVLDAKDATIAEELTKKANVSASDANDFACGLDSDTGLRILSGFIELARSKV